jgi:small subunit ribosomal protein S9
MAKEKATSAKASAPAKKASLTPLAHAVGRRKKSIARVWLRRGAGNIHVNDLTLADYFDTSLMRNTAAMPFSVCPISTNYDVQVIVAGGGKHGQADAIKLAIARAMVLLDQTLKPVLRSHKLLTVDSRVKERKKYGRKAARRRFQFVKR